MPRRASTILTDTAIRKLRPAGQRYEMRDASRPGFGVRVELDGRKVFFQRFGARGERRLTLGAYSPGAFGLAEARAAADKARADHAAGRDPIGAKQERRRLETAEREARKAARAGRPMPGTFADLAERYIRDAWRRRRERTAREYERKLRVEVLPRWGARLLGEIRRADVLRLVEETRERGGVCSNRTLALVRAVFQFGVDREELDANPALRIPRRYLYAEQPRERVLTRDELRAILAVVDELGPIVGAVFRMILLTAQRPGEVLRIRWDEIGRDEGGSFWQLPDELAKNGRGHRVPLSQQAIAVLEALRSQTGSTPWVFASPSPTVEGPIQWLSHATVRLRRSSGVPDFTPHDLRRTAATLMGERGVRPDVIERVLNHTPAKIARTYNRAAYDAEKRQALAILGDLIESVSAGESAPRSGAEVVPFARA
jgi:integrase